MPVVLECLALTVGLTTQVDRADLESQLLVKEPREPRPCPSHLPESSELSSVVESRPSSPGSLVRESYVQNERS